MNLLSSLLYLRDHLRSQETQEYSLGENGIYVEGNLVHYENIVDIYECKNNVVIITVSHRNYKLKIERPETLEFLYSKVRAPKWGG